jgi:hypothetical protein
MIPSRRLVLRGAGALLALPAFVSLLPRSARGTQQQAPRRAVWWYFANGPVPGTWVPQSEGPGYDLPDSLGPLLEVQDEVSVLSGLSAVAHRESKPGNPAHENTTATWLTDVPINSQDEGYDAPVGVSADQWAAEQLGAATPFPSLQLGARGPTHRNYWDSLSWAGPFTPLPPSCDPRFVFDRLFGSVARSASHKSVLEAAAGNARALSARLGAEDRLKLEEYLTGVESLQARLLALEEHATCEVSALDPATAVEGGELRFMVDVVVHALQCDLTRIVTFHSGDSGSLYPFLGVQSDHHTATHEGPDFPNLTPITRHLVGEFAHLVASLRDSPDVDGSSLLDNTAVFGAAEFGDPNNHDSEDVPVLLAGGGACGLQPGRHTRFSGEPFQRVYHDIFGALGVDGEGWGTFATEALGV